MKSVMPSNHLILCCPLLLLPSIFPSIRVFSNESTLYMKWPKYGRFSINISPFNEHPALRWQRNRMGRPLSTPQIHQKNISMLSKFYKTTSECWQRTSDTQKSRSLSSKTGRKNIKDEKRDTGGREGAPSWEGRPILGRES